MKIKGVIKNLNFFKKLKNDNSKIHLGISLELLRVVWGQFSLKQFLVPACTSSHGIQSLSNTVSANCIVLICCTYHFQSRSFFFVYFLSSVCRSPQCLIFSLTQGAKGDHLFRLTCSVVLWEGRNTVKKHHWHAWGVLTVSGPHWVPPFTVILSQCTMLRLQVALQGNCPMQALG